MEHAGSSDTIEDAERKGLGTPATRAAIIEKLIEKGFVERKKKQILPTADGRNLIRILPEMIKSPKLTAEWENDLTLISKGQKNAEKPEEEESDFPDIKIGQVFECVVVKFSEHFTAPPKHYTDVIFCERKEWIGIEERSSA